MFNIPALIFRQICPEKFQKEFLRTFGCWILCRKRNRRLPVLRRTNTAQSYSGFNGRGLSTYSRNYPGSTRVETTVVHFATTVVMEK
ncbi:unnamed protein product [Allacma fusca]|uniref:Uncharacterized protein n=1 Tax=Allacma fusca TaxID=39272 RepID=A0A8J2JGT4_9HEXA|nr:unnamed protein product [Allacma fusca]